MDFKILFAVFASAIVAFDAFAEDAYVESDGTSFMNTGYYVNPETHIEIDFAFATLEKGKRIAGANGETKLYIYCDGGGQFAIAYGDSVDWGKANGYYCDTARHVAVYDCPNNVRKYMTNGEATWTSNLVNAVTKTSAIPLALYANMLDAGGESAEAHSKIRIYGCKIWDAETLVRDYRPCIMNDVVGFRDAVSGDFMCGADAAAFASGGDIPSLSAPYVQSDGTSFMNTRHLATPNTKIDVAFALVSTDDADGKIIGANQSGVNHRMGVYVTGVKSIGFIYGDAQKTAWTSSAQNIDTNPHHAIIDYPNCRMSYVSNDKTISVAIDAKMAETNITKTAAHPLALFGGMKDATGVVGESVMAQRIYSCRIWDDGVLKHDYRPCVKGGVVGFRDRIDGCFICGEDVSKFTAGGDVEEILDDAYVATTYNDGTLGQCAIDTEYAVGVNTKVVLDYALMANSSERSGDWYLLDARHTTSPWDAFNVYATTAKGYRCSCGVDSKWKESGMPATSAMDIRRQVSVDAYNKKVVFATGGYTNVAFSAAAMNGTIASTLLLCKPQVDGLSGAVKIYGLKIYESDAIVRDYVPYLKDGVPGLYDAQRDSFITAAEGTPKVHKQLQAGGNLAGLVHDAYLESDGTGIINSGYAINENSKIVVDYQLLTTNLQTRIVGYEVSGSPRVCLYTAGSSAICVALDDDQGKGSIGTSKYLDYYRHTATLEGAGGTYSLTGGGIDWSVANGGTTITTTASGTFGIFGEPRDKDWTAVWRLGKQRIYSVKIYESDTLVHQYLPYAHGTTVGLKDTVTGVVLTDFGGSTTAFSVSGAGSDGSRACILAPESANIPVGGSTVLSAYAPGAHSYVWTVDGVEQATTTDSLSMSWRQRMKSAEVTCTPVFSIDGTSVKGTISQATVAYARRGTIVILR